MKFRHTAWIARRNGATVGDCVCMPMSLAKKANKNLMIGSHVVIQTDFNFVYMCAKTGSRWSI